MPPQISIVKSESIQDIPLVLHIPHSGTIIPDDVRERILLNDHQLSEELKVVTDAFTDELFSNGVGLGGTAVVNNYSRLVFDPERFPKDEDEVMSGRGRGAVYLKTSDMAMLRNPHVYNAERDRIIIRFASEYNGVITNAVTKQMIDFGRCLLLDCHSFPSKPLKCELDQELDRPMICLGTHDSHTPKELVDALTSCCHNYGLSYEVNKPFAGTYVPLLWYRNAQVSSIMIEVRRDLYMDEVTGERNPSFDDVKRIIDHMVETVAQYAKSMTPLF